MSERKAPIAPTKKAIKEAKAKAKVILDSVLPQIKEVEELADKFGFNVEFLDKKYIPYHHDDDSMWMPSDDEVEGSGYLDFQWTASNEGRWTSETDFD